MLIRDFCRNILLVHRLCNIEIMNIIKEKIQIQHVI